MEPYSRHSLPVCCTVRLFCSLSQVNTSTVQGQMIPSIAHLLPVMAIQLYCHYIHVQNPLQAHGTLSQCEVVDLSLAQSIQADSSLVCHADTMPCLVCTLVLETVLCGEKG